MSAHRKYKIIQFLSEGEKDIADIDIVPSTWITYDPISGSLLTKFIEGPYNKKNSEKLHLRVKNCSNPLPDWPQFEILIKGQAGKFLFDLGFLNLHFIIKE